MRTISMIITLATVLTACSSISDVDLGKVEPNCGKDCTTNYSQCVSKFSLLPAFHKSDCADALKLCVQACPAK